MRGSEPLSEQSTVSTIQHCESHAATHFLFRVCESHAIQLFSLSVCRVFRDTVIFLSCFSCLSRFGIPVVSHQTCFLGIALGCILFVSGCNPDAESPSTASQPTTLPPVDRVQPGDPEWKEVGSDDAGNTPSSEPVSNEEAEEFARKWEESIRTGDAAGGAMLIDMDALSDRILAPFDVNDQFRRGFRSGMSQTIESILEQLSAEEQKGGSYRVVNVAMRGGQPHAMFRLLGSDGSLNYHDLRIVRKEAGLVADQFFIAMTGEDISDSVRENAAPVIRASQSPVARVTGEDERQRERLNRQYEMALAMRSSDYVKVMQIYEELPSDEKESKSVQLHRLVAAMNLESDEYLQVIDEYEQRFPNDPSLPMITMDAAVMREDFEQLEKSYAALQLWVGGDPLLDLMVASTFASFGRVERADEIVADIDVNAVGIADAHEYALNMALVKKDHEAVLTQLRKLREYGFGYGDLQEAEGFEEFVKSSAYQAWLSDE